MNKIETKNLKTILYPLVLLAVFVFPAAAQTISIASQTVTPGSSVTVPIVASGITNLAAYTINLNYNQSVVVVDSVTAGALGAPTTNINNAAGLTQMSAFSVTPVSGTIILANVVLRAVGTASQTGPLNLTVTTLSDNNGNAIPNTVINGTFAIQGTLPAAPPSGFISGTILDPDANRIPGITVIAQNGTDTFSSVSNSNGDYVITIPGLNVNKYYQITVTLSNGRTGGGVQTLLVTSGNTTVAQNIVLVSSTFPITKNDVASQPSIPADGASTTVITATITGKDSNGVVGPLRNGIVNSSITAFVNFYLQNGSLDVTTGNNGTFSGGALQVLNVPIDNNGQAKVVLTSGLNPGSVKVFNNVTVKALNGFEVNSSISITFTALTGEITGTVRDSNANLIPGATVTAQRFYSCVGGSGFEPITNDAFGNPLVATTNGIGDYVLDRIPLKSDNNTCTFQFTPTGAPATPPGSVTNYILVTANKSGFNDGIMKTYLEAQTTATGNDIVLTTVPTFVTGILVQADNTTHQQLDSASIKQFPATWSITATLLTNTGAPLVNRNVTFTVNNSNIAAFSGGSSTGYALTGADGVARIMLSSNIANGEVMVTGTNSGFSDYDFIMSAGVGQLSGIVTNENQVLLPGATVTVLNPDGTVAKDMIGNPLQTTTPPTGNAAYTFTAVPSGTYTVRATLGNQTGFHYLVTIVSGTTDANVVIVGGVPTTITGFVTNATNGAAISGADIFIDGVDTTINTLADGSYTITNVVPGSRIVMAVKSGYNNGTVTVNASAGTVTTANIQLQPASGFNVRTYLPCGATAAQRKTGVTNAMNDYFFNHVITKDNLTSVLNEYFFPTCS